MVRRREDAPGQSEYGEIRSFLAQKGVSQSIINEYFPPNLNGFNTWGDIDNRLTELFRSFGRLI